MMAYVDENGNNLYLHLGNKNIPGLKIKPPVAMV
jgi:hypothetical protein